VVKVAGRPERIAHIANRPLNTTLLIAGPHLARARLEVIVCCNSSSLGLKWIWLPVPLQHADFKLS